MDKTLFKSCYQFSFQLTNTVARPEYCTNQGDKKGNPPLERSAKKGNPWDKHATVKMNVKIHNTTLHVGIEPTTSRLTVSRSTY